MLTTSKYGPNVSASLAVTFMARRVLTEQDSLSLTSRVNFSSIPAGSFNPTKSFWMSFGSASLNCLWTLANSVSGSLLSGQCRMFE